MKWPDGRKPCTKCGKVKLLSEFYTKKIKSGITYQSKCKACHSEYYKRHNAENKERIREHQKNYYSQNKEIVQAINKKWRDKNKEKVAKRHSRWRKEFYKPREVELRIARHASKYGAEGFHTSNEFEKLLRQYDGKCAYCGENEATDREHVIPLSRGGSNYIGNILPVCRSCNTSKKEKLLVEWRYRDDTRFKRWCF